jgi:hypothetical protein
MMTFLSSGYFITASGRIFFLKILKTALLSSSRSSCSENIPSFYQSGFFKNTFQNHFPQFPWVLLSLLKLGEFFGIIGDLLVQFCKFFTFSAREKRSLFSFS